MRKELAALTGKVCSAWQSLQQDKADEYASAHPESKSNDIIDQVIQKDKATRDPMTYIPPCGKE